MDHHALEDIAYTDEMARVAMAAWGDQALGPGGAALINIERQTKLFAIVRNPYHAPLAAMPTLELMRACALNMLESLHYKEAFRALNRIETIERARARDGYEEPPRPLPPSGDSLPPSPVQMPLAIPPGATRAWLEALGDRELTDRLRAARLEPLRRPAPCRAPLADPNPPFT